MKPHLRRHGAGPEPGVLGGHVRPARGHLGVPGSITVAATPATGSAFRLNSTSTVQQKGQYLTIVWTNQSTPVTAADQAVIDRFVAQQTDALSATTS